jgi:acetolactate synthase-1/2/3 large subunit
MLRVEDSGLAQAAELIRNAKRPIILAGHGVSESGAMEQVRTLAERAQIPVALTLLGLGAFPASHPLNMGMMGMHGEAWVNHAIQEADLLIACGMRFDDRVTGSTSTYSLKSKKIHIEVDPAEINKNIKVDVALVGDLREVLEQLLPRIPAATARVAQDHRSQQGRGRRARHQEPARLRPPLRRARDSRHLAHHRRQRHRRHRRGPAPDVGGAVLPPRASALAGHLRRPGHHGLRAARGHRRKIRLPRQRSLGRRRRRRLPDDRSRALHHRAGKNQDQHRHHQQRLLGMVRQWQEFFYDSNYEATPLISPDFVKLADAHGIPGPRRPHAREVEALSPKPAPRPARSCSTSWSKRKSLFIP